MMSLYFVHYFINKLYSLNSPRLSILFKNEDLLMVDKPFDLKINSNYAHELTVQTQLRERFPALVNPSLRHEFYFPHRLDFATSGVMCIPIHHSACRMVSDSFCLRKIKKYYIALVRGLLSSDFLDLQISIGRDMREQNLVKMCTDDKYYCTSPVGARTLFLVLEEGLYDNYPATKLLIRPVTGRTHQIRIHLSYLGHGIIGDYTYSNRKDVKPPRMYLHSKRMILNLKNDIVDVESLESFNAVPKWNTVRVKNIFDNLAYHKIEDLV